MQFITLDRIKIKANNKYLLDKQIKFNEDYDHRSGILKGEYYSSKADGNVPYNLFIATSEFKQTLTLEFSSKVLKEDYPKLISRETIEDCLDRINQLGICQIDTQGILQTGCITSMDITTDVDLDLTPIVLDTLNERVGNYRRYKWAHYEKEGISFTRDVKSKNCKESLILYNKNKELQRSDNSSFLNSLSNKYQVLDYFIGKTRFELSLDTPRKIKQYTNVKDTYIWDVLNTTANPLLNVFDSIFGNIEVCTETKPQDYETFTMDILLAQYNNDLKQIEQALRGCYKARSGLIKRMNKIQRHLEYKRTSTDKQVNILQNVRNLLL
ncbi:MAG: hypothetical protein IKR05_10915 [Prevotella sp.]|nr:hypothetical protein [Prevotella sp.]MBR6263707.1 hypothetical protein [Prevotella sp.]